MSLKKLERISAFYRPRMDDRRPSYAVVNWASPMTQLARYEILADGVPLAGKRILDVGCGLGDFWAFLQERKIETEYTGVDLLPEMVVSARARRPGAVFHCLDLFGGQAPPRADYDLIFCSGVFSLDLGNNLDFVPQAFARLREFAARPGWIVSNFLHVRAHGQEPPYFYYDPAVLLERLRPLGGIFRLRDDYLINDFTVLWEL